MELRAFIQQYPNGFHLATASTAALFGLTTTPTFVPVVVTLAALLLYAPVLFNRNRRHPYVYTSLLWLSISVCSSIGRLVPALSALSTAGPSVAVLLGMSAVASAVAILAIFADVFISSRTGVAQTVFFPAIWTSLWVAISHLPFNMGRLTSWSPAGGTQAYQWMAPWTGPAGIDWVTAAWAVVISQSIGIWYMGGTEEDEIPTMGTPKRNSRSGQPWVLALILTTLTIPSFILPTSPLPVVLSDTVSSFRVGCVLPSTTSPELDDYITESLALNSQFKGTKLLLWPESAVSFRSPSEREDAFNSILEKLEHNHDAYWGVSFEERFTSDSGTSKSRNGIVLLSHEGVQMEYYKRSLVPIAESFRLTPGSSPPETFPISLSPPKGKKKWDRTVDVVTSICLDFAMPSPFRDLESKPGLILAPARTWDRAIGNRMWEEVKQRANEVGSLALWCDGGIGGVSGVAGAGYNDFYQVGGGSWSRAVGIQYPFHSTLTFYARVGDASIVAVSWFFVLGPIAFAMFAARFHLRARVGWMTQFYHRARASLRREPAVNDIRNPPNLIEFGSD
ncbi:hypothetical protein C8R45DRAFT_46547 [Mycena sanguinolenta]|nr:hypothetical protein C8R45DRAFT_46547 [Mycena sanguinolenta]